MKLKYEYLEFANRLSTMEAYYRLKLVQIRNEIDNTILELDKQKGIDEIIKEG